MTTTELLREDAGEAWTVITTDPWTEKLSKKDGLTRASLVKYLVQDQRFLDAFTVLLSAMLAATTTLEDRKFGAQFLAFILSEENTYFERSLTYLEVTPEERAQADEEETANFDSLMRSTAKTGQLHSMLAVLVVCEWSYLTWGERVKVTKDDDLPFVQDEWISLHSGDDFAKVVTYLRGLLDKLDLSETELMETRTAFHAAVKCEREFWAMVNRY